MASQCENCTQEAKLKALKELLDEREKALDAREHDLNEKERELNKKLADIAILEGHAPSAHRLDPVKTVVTTCEMTAQQGKRRAHDALKHVETELRPGIATSDVDKMNDLPDDAFLTPQPERHH